MDLRTSFLRTVCSFLNSFEAGSFVVWFALKGRLVSDSREEVSSKLTWAFWVTDEFSWNGKLESFSKGFRAQQEIPIESQYQHLTLNLTLNQNGS